MAKTPETATVAATETKAKRTRAPSAPKPVFAIIRVKDADGNVLDIPKGQVELVSFERSAEEVLSKIEGGQHPGALYLRGMLPAGR